MAPSFAGDLVPEASVTLTASASLPSSAVSSTHPPASEIPEVQPTVSHAHSEVSVAESNSADSLVDARADGTSAVQDTVSPRRDRDHTHSSGTAMMAAGASAALAAMSSTVSVHDDSKSTQIVTPAVEKQSPRQVAAAASSSVSPRPAAEQTEPARTSEILRYTA